MSSKIQAGNSDNLSRKGMGRPKGSINKTTAAAKDMIAHAAERLGGVDRIVDWAKADPANERVFWSTMFPKLLPVQVANAEGETFKTEEVGRGAAKLVDFLNGIAERSHD